MSASVPRPRPPVPEGWTTLPNGLRVRKAKAPTMSEDLDTFYRERGMVTGGSCEDPFETEATASSRGASGQGRRPMS